MCQLSEQQRKQILADPLTCYQQQGGNSKQHEQQLQQLHAQYSEFKQQLKAAQDRSKKLSRQIGEAKRAGQSADTLLAQMKQQSAEVKQLKTQLSAVSQSILERFKTVSETNTAAEPPTAQRYRSDTTGTDDIQAGLLQAGDHSAWRDYVDNHPAASIYHRLEWKHLIQKVFGHNGYYFVAKKPDGQITGVLPLIRLNSRLFGDFMVSMPYFNYGGALADSADIEQLLIAAANSHAAELGVSHIEYRDDIERPGMPARTDKVNMILPLPVDETALWQSFGAKLRSQIKRAQRESHQVIIGRHNCLHDFYSVFARNMRDLGTPVYSRKLFSEILDTFAEQSRIVIVKLDNRPVAAAFLLGHGERMEIPWASTIRDVNHLSINMLLYWEVLKLSTRSGYRYFDFGRSSKHAGTYRFKQQWGAKPRPSYWHYWLSDGMEVPKLNPDNPKYALAIRLWQKLPVWASRIIGPPIVRNLP